MSKEEIKKIRQKYVPKPIALPEKIEKLSE